MAAKMFKSWAILILEYNDNKLSAGVRPFWKAAAKLAH